MPWKLTPADSEAAARLSASLAVPPAVARVLAARGLADEEHARRYLEPQLRDLVPPRQMADLAKAVERLGRAVAGGERIGVFGDYDVDGVSSAALCADYLVRAGADVTIRVARRDEGYGFSPAQAREMVEREARVIVLTDCGTSDDAAVGELAGAGIDVIAVDHHRITDVSAWPGFALVNPHRPDCGFPFKGLCSVGLAFYVMAALRRDLVGRGLDVPDPRENLDLVALGTIADVAPLDGENRILVAKGLQQLARTDRPGLRELARIAEVEGKVPTSEQVAWRLAPRLNAPGRLGDAAIALDCLWQRDAELAVQSARRCHALNEERKEIQRRILAEALAQGEERRDDPFCLVAGADWHPGVIGIVASKLTEHFDRPAAVIALEGERGRASARSLPGVDLFALLDRCGEHMLRYGGHAAAAGFSVQRDKIESLREALCREAAPALDGRERSEVKLAALVGLAAVDHALCKALERLEPYGEANPQPVFGARAVRVEMVRDVGLDHIKLALRQDEAVRQAIGFGMRHKRPNVGDDIDVAFVAEIDNWRGPRLQLRLVDLAPAGAGIAGINE
ncbi:MAG: single-stranded-DNA-specific exonuclease RecJ [Myxococcales bacterium]|nr:single-stranded-DNA-specific exonuclease RecJ [Myxococcales bacterium]